MPSDWLLSTCVGRSSPAARIEPLPRNSLRPDEIVWGRAPARLDLGGGWTDTPPYALEHGGCVLNAAVELNGQPPIQAFARVMQDPLIRIRSIDVGTQLELREWDQLLDSAVAAGEFSLVQAALAISGFAPHNGGALRDVLKEFGGDWRSRLSRRSRKAAAWARRASWARCCWP